MGDMHPALRYPVLIIGGAAAFVMVTLFALVFLAALLVGGVAVAALVGSKDFSFGGVSDQREESMWDSPKEPKRPNGPLNEDDVKGFMGAADQRKRGNYREAEEFLDKLSTWHRLRVERIIGDLEWLREKAKQYGFSENIIRWLV